MGTAVFYVSGHGFGHAARASQVIGELALTFGHRVVVRTTAPEFLFLRGSAGLAEKVTVERAEVDQGPSQPDCFTTDFAATYSRYASMLTSFDGLLEAEFRHVSRIKPSAVVADISPLGVAVGKRLGVPTFVVANFLWDWIFKDYAKKYPKFDIISSLLTGIYKEADAILRTPFSGGFEPYSNVVDIPLIARRSAKSREDARRSLGLDENGKYALVSFGGIGAEGFYTGLEDRVTSMELLTLRGTPGRSGRTISFDGAKVAHEDLVMAADVVIGKLGYGLCAEIAAAGRPILYTPRNDFVEYNVLEDGIRKLVPSFCLERDEFFGKSLEPALAALLKVLCGMAPDPMNGAHVTAGMINDGMGAL
ncbi:MAG: hypothetical protein HY751_04240 [Nitrospinae bacterium]|nr:hypothetical protein [Nitrospinota bacterium]